MSRTILSASPDSTYTLREHRPERLREQAERLRSEVANLPETDPARARKLAKADQCAAEAELPPIVWHIRRPSTRQRLRLSSIEEKERDIGARKGREVVRSRIDALSWELVTLCVIGVDGLTDDQGEPVRYDPRLGEESKEAFWGRIPLNWVSELVEAIVETFHLTDADLGN